MGLPVYRKKSASGDNNKSSSKHGMDSGKKGSGRARRRPANGKAPGRRDPEAVARMEAEAKLAAERLQNEGTDRSWLLPTNVDYYTDRGMIPGSRGIRSSKTRKVTGRFWHRAVYYVLYLLNAQTVK